MSLPSPPECARIDIAPDGTVTSRDYHDIYFQRDGMAESRHVFLTGNRLSERFSILKDGENFCIGELGFGTGLNFLLTWQLWRAKASTGARLSYLAFEKHPLTISDFSRLKPLWPGLEKFHEALENYYPAPISGAQRLVLDDGRVTLTLFCGDALAELSCIADSKIHAWYLDGFAPAGNPDLWQAEIFRQMARLSAPDATAASFTAARGVRDNLALAGFSVTRAKGFGHKRHMIVAQRQPGAEELSSPSPQDDDFFDVAIVGAGIAGCAAALALTRKGLRVLLLERNNTVAEETSGNPWGAVYPKLTAAPSGMGMFYLQAFLFFSQQRKMLAAMAPKTDDCLRACGVLHLDLSEEDTLRHAKIAALHHHIPGLARHLTQAEAQAVAGVTLPAGGLFYSEGCMVAPAKFCHLLVTQAEERGMHLKTGTPVHALHPDQELWKILGPSPNIIARARHIVLCGNLDSAAFAQAAALTFESVRGQIISVPETDASAALKTVLCHDGYLLPAVQSRHVLGASFLKQHPGAFAPTEEETRDILKRTEKNLPNLQLANTEEAVAAAMRHARVGYRCTTYDRMPVIGKLPETDIHPNKNIWIASGYGSHGLTAAPLGGEIIASLIAKEPPPVSKIILQALSPERLIRRQRHKAATVIVR